MSMSVLLNSPISFNIIILGNSLLELATPTRESSNNVTRASGNILSDGRQSVGMEASDSCLIFVLILSSCL